MIKVFLPQNNRNLMSDLTSEIIADVVLKIFDVNTFITERDSDDRRTGRFIKIVNDENEETHFVCFSNPNNNSRNAHLMQFVSPTYVKFYNDESVNKKIDIYIIRPDSNDRTDYIKMFYRCFLTIGINILNLGQLGISGIMPFTNYDDLKSYRNKTSERNTRNRQTYFTDDDTQVSLYGKTFGANAMESFIFGLSLQKISEKQVVFYEVVDNESDSISRDQKNILINNGVIFGDVIELLPSGYAKPGRRTGSRNTPSFHYNLLQKFGEKRCYLCGCDMEHLVIGSHIERITDIDRSECYEESEKSRRATDGDNGLWLCANHDKMFEFGIIYFENTLLKIGSLITDEFEKQFINKSIFETKTIFPTDLLSVGEINENNFNIRVEHFNENMNNYISIHKERIA